MLIIRISDSKRNEIVFLTYILSGIGFCVGLLSLFIGFSTSTPAIPADPAIDDLPNFGPFFRFMGLFFLLTSCFSFIGCLLFHKENKIGWLMVFLVYLFGTSLTGYFLIVVTSKYFYLAIGSPMFFIYLLLLACGIYVLYNLIFKVNYFVVRKNKSM